MGYKTKKLKTHWMSGKFFALRVQVGWSIYPVMYRTKAYIVDLKYIPAEAIRLKKEFEFDFVGRIYEFANPEKVRGWHKRKRIYSETLNYLALDDKTILDLRHMSEEEFKMYLPLIIKTLFMHWENNKAVYQFDRDLFYAAETWDGTVE